MDLRADGAGVPNDLFFEVTGVLQVVPAALAARLLVQLGARSPGAST